MKTIFGALDGGCAVLKLPPTASATALVAAPRIRSRRVIACCDGRDMDPLFRVSRVGGQNIHQPAANCLIRLPDQRFDVQSVITSDSPASHASAAKSLKLLGLRDRRLREPVPTG